MPDFWTIPSKDERKPRRRLMAENSLTGHEYPQPHIVSSPPGTQAPAHLINYTPDTNEVHGPGSPAPLDRLNYSLMPHDGLRSNGNGVGAGADYSGVTSPGAPPGPGTQPGMDQITGRYGQQASMRANTFSPGQPPLSPTPYGVGPGPRIQASGPAERPFEQRGSMAGNTSDFGAGQEGRQRTDKAAPGAFTGLGDGDAGGGTDPSAATPPKNPNAATTSKDAAIGAASLGTPAPAGFRFHIVRQGGDPEGRPIYLWLINDSDPSKNQAMGWYDPAGLPDPRTTVPAYQNFDNETRKLFSSAVAGGKNSGDFVIEEVYNEGTGATEKRIFDKTNPEDKGRVIGRTAPDKPAKPPLETPGGGRQVGTGAGAIVYRVKEDGTEEVDQAATREVRQAALDAEDREREADILKAELDYDAAMGTATIFQTIEDADGQVYLLNGNTGSTMKLGSKDLTKNRVQLGNTLVFLDDKTGKVKDTYTAPKDMVVDEFNGITYQYDPRNPSGTMKELFKDPYWQPTEENKLAKSKADLAKTLADLDSGVIDEMEARVKIEKDLFDLENIKPEMMGGGSFYLAPGAKMRVDYNENFGREEKLVDTGPMDPRRREAIDAMRSQLGGLGKKKGAAEYLAMAEGMTGKRTDAAQPAATSTTPTTPTTPTTTTTTTTDKGKPPAPERADQRSGRTPLGNEQADQPGRTGTVNPDDPNYLGSAATPEQIAAARAEWEAQQAGEETVGEEIVEPDPNTLTEPEPRAGWKPRPRPRAAAQPSSSIVDYETPWHEQAYEAGIGGWKRANEEPDRTTPWYEQARQAGIGGWGAGADTGDDDTWWMEEEDRPRKYRPGQGPRHMPRENRSRDVDEESLEPKDRPYGRARGSMRKRPDDVENPGQLGRGDFDPVERALERWRARHGLPGDMPPSGEKAPLTWDEGLNTRRDMREAWLAAARDPQEVARKEQWKKDAEAKETEHYANLAREREQQAEIQAEIQAYKKAWTAWLAGRGPDPGEPPGGWGGPMMDWFREKPGVPSPSKPSVPSPSKPSVPRQMSSDEQQELTAERAYEEHLRDTRDPAEWGPDAPARSARQPASTDKMPPQSWWDEIKALRGRVQEGLANRPELPEEKWAREAREPAPAPEPEKIDIRDWEDEWDRQRAAQRDPLREPSPTADPIKRALGSETEQVANSPAEAYRMLYGEDPSQDIQDWLKPEGWEGAPSGPPEREREFNDPDALADLMRPETQTALERDPPGWDKPGDPDDFNPEIELRPKDMGWNQEDADDWKWDGWQWMRDTRTGEVKRYYDPDPEQEKYLVDPNLPWPPEEKQKVPEGYSQEDLDASNPYTQWMREQEPEPQPPRQEEPEIEWMKPGLWTEESKSSGNIRDLLPKGHDQGPQIWDIPKGHQPGAMPELKPNIFTPPVRLPGGHTPGPPIELPKWVQNLGPDAVRALREKLGMGAGQGPGEMGGMLGGAPGGGPPNAPGAAPGAPPAGAPGAPAPGGAPMPPVPPQDVAGIGHRFGQPMNEGEPFHSGVDLQATEGTPTVSPEDGIVEEVRDDPAGLGLTVIVRDKNGMQHKLGHLSSTDAYRGMVVAKGQNLARVGSSGNATGSHLHWAVRDQTGQPTDPTPALGDMGGLPPVPGTEMMGPPGGSGSPPGMAGPPTGAPGGPPPGPQGATGMPPSPDAPPPGAIAKSLGMGQDTWWEPLMGAGADMGAGQGEGYMGITPGQQAEIDQENKRIEMEAENNRRDNETRRYIADQEHKARMKEIDQNWLIHQDDDKRQQEINAENTRHNQASEQIERDRIQADITIQQMKDASALQLQQMQQGNQIYMQQGEQAFQDWQNQQKQRMDILGSALKNPWLQKLSGMTPGPGYQGEQVGGQNISNLVNQILQPYDPRAWGAQNAPSIAGLGGTTAGGPQGALQTPGGGMFQQQPQGPGGTPQNQAYMQGGQVYQAGQTPQGYSAQTGQGQPDYMQWRGWDPFQRAAYRTNQEALGPGAWEQVGAQMGEQFAQAGGTPEVTRMQAAASDAAGRAGMEMTGELFGQTGEQFWQDQSKQWGQAKAPTVKQNLTGAAGVR